MCALLQDIGKVIFLFNNTSIYDVSYDSINFLTGALPVASALSPMSGHFILKRKSQVVVRLPGCGAKSTLPWARL